MDEETKARAAQLNKCVESLARTASRACSEISEVITEQMQLVGVSAEKSLMNAQPAIQELNRRYRKLNIGD